MERQWREEKEPGGTEGRGEGWDSMAGFLCDAVAAGLAWKACKNEERNRTAAIASQRQTENENTVSSGMTEEDIAKLHAGKVVIGKRRLGVG
jgi:hypothetical protein